MQFVDLENLATYDFLAKRDGAEFAVEAKSTPVFFRGGHYYFPTRKNYSTLFARNLTE